MDGLTAKDTESQKEQFCVCWGNLCTLQIRTAELESQTCSWGRQNPRPRFTISMIQKMSAKNYQNEWIIVAVMVLHCRAKYCVGSLTLRACEIFYVMTIPLREDISLTQRAKYLLTSENFFANQYFYSFDIIVHPFGYTSVQYERSSCAFARCDISSFDNAWLC